MTKPSTCGLYVIESPSGGQYIGSSANIPKRLREHANYFLRGDHYNRLLAAAANKYGAAAMKMRVLLTCERDVLRSLEQLAIDHLQPRYNIERTVAKVLHDFWIDPVWRARNAERCRVGSVARWADPIYREKMLAVMAATRARPEIKEQSAARFKAMWTDPEYAARAKIRSGKTMRKLQACPEFSARLSVWMSKVMKERCKDLDFCRRRDAAASARNRRPIYCITTGVYYPTVGEAAKTLNVSVSLINKQFRGLKTRTGWEWRYLTDDELLERGYEPAQVRRDMPPKDRKPPSRTKPCLPVLCIELGLWFASNASASAAFGGGKGAIPSAICGDQKAFGYSWRYPLVGEAPEIAQHEPGSLMGKRFDSRLRPVVCIETGQTFASAKHAVAALQANAKAIHHIRDVLRGRGKNALGYSWKYADDREAVQ